METTLATGYTLGDENTLFQRILEPVRKLHMYEITCEEIESVYWKILLGLGSQSQFLRNSGKVMPFALVDETAAVPETTTGIQYIQHTDRKENGYFFLYIY